MPRSRFLALLLALPAIAGRAGAQGFEGTITMTFASTSGGHSYGVSARIATKGDRTVTTSVLGSSAGAPAGAEVRTIIDRKANTVTVLVATPTGGVSTRGLVTVTSLSDTSSIGGGSADTHPDIRKLGTSQTIAGVSCDDYEIKEERTTPISACITTALGAFVFPPSGRGMMGGPGSASPGWAKAFGGKPGFPLKVWSTDGHIALQVIAIDKTPVADSVFAIPEGYVSWPGGGG